MSNVPMQTLFGAGLLFCLAFSDNDSSSPAPAQADANLTVQLPCDDGDLSRADGTTPNSQGDAQLCRQIDFR